MKGYRKIGSGLIYASKKQVEDNDNYEMDAQIRTSVHSLMIGEVEKSGCENFCVVIYKRVQSTKGGEQQRQIIPHFTQ